MSDSSAVVLASLVAALLGGGGIGSYLTTREQARRERRAKVRERRLEGVVAFVTTVQTYLDLERELLHLYRTSAVDDVEDVLRRYRERWHELIAATAVVLVLGPKDLADTAQELRIAVGERSDVFEERGRGRREDAEWEKRYDVVAREKVNRARDACLAAARAEADRL